MHVNFGTIHLVANRQPPTTANNRADTKQLITTRLLDFFHLFVSNE